MLAHIPEVISLASIVAVPAYFLVLWSTIVLGAYEKNRMTRWLITVVFSVSAYALIALTSITNSFMTYDAFIDMMNAAGFTEDAILQCGVRSSYHRPAFFLLLGIGLQSRRLPRVPLFVLGATPWLAVGLMVVTLYARGGTGAQGQPPAVIPLSYLALWSYDAWQGDIGNREPVRLTHVAQSTVRNIVFIVDERQ